MKRGLTNTTATSSIPSVSIMYNVKKQMNNEEILNKAKASQINKVVPKRIQMTNPGQGSPPMNMKRFLTIPDQSKPLQQSSEMLLGKPPTNENLIE